MAVVSVQIVMKNIDLSRIRPLAILTFWADSLNLPASMRFALCLADDYGDGFHISFHSSESKAGDITWLHHNSISSNLLLSCTGRHIPSPLETGIDLENGSVLQLLLPSVNNWIILMNRFDGSVSFNRSWTDYRNGFVNIGRGEFWLGNEKMHRLTSRFAYVLRIEVFINSSPGASILGGYGITTPPNFGVGVAGSRRGTS